MDDLTKNKASNEAKSTPFEEVDVFGLIIILLKKAWLIVLIALLVSASFVAGTKFLITPTYRSSFTAYVNNKSQFNNSQDSLTMSDISAAEQLVRAYSKTIESRAVLSAAAAAIRLNDSYDDIAAKISTEVENETFIITVYVVDTSPEAAYALAQSIANVAPNIIADIIEGSSMNIIDMPQKPNSIYKPSYIKNGVIGFLLGALGAVAYIVIKTMTDDKVKNESELESRFSIPVVGVIPDMLATPKSTNSYYDYEYAYRRSEIKRSGGNNGKER